MDEIRRRMRGAQWILAALLLGAGTIGVAGCDEGPAEDTGEEIDDALDDAGDELEDTGDDLE